MPNRNKTQRRGAAIVELALLLPFLAFLLAACLDFGRIFYYSQVIENSARNGAIYAAGLSTANSPYATLTDAALSDAAGLSPQPTVTSTTGTDAQSKPYVRVTVSWEFRRITLFPGIPSSVTLTRTVQVRVAS